LGRAHDPGASTDEHALEIGTNQFKITARELNDAIKQSEWARKNILIGFAATSNGGTSGLKKDASLEATRREIERTADLVFSGDLSAPIQRVFPWPRS
jgi:hypothetical protein